MKSNSTDSSSLSSSAMTSLELEEFIFLSFSCVKSLQITIRGPECSFSAVSFSVSLSVTTISSVTWLSFGYGSIMMLSSLIELLIASSIFRIVIQIL